ncbi:MAG: 50S ribosomal protein L17 [Anaerohalosphaeraceae bacterium]|nr:50S ribosomal protein L17 [Anaerohalosphaeraceae bacterium]
MRHRIAGGQLNRTSEHRLAMRRNLAASLFEHETISTTVQKAKHVKSFAEKLITLARKGDLASRRRAIAILGNRNIVEQTDKGYEKKGTVIGKLFSEIGPRFLDRNGGYTRIIRLSKNRLGDNGQLALLQLVGVDEKVEPKAKSKKKKAETVKAVAESKETKVAETDEVPEQATE